MSKREVMKILKQLTDANHRAFQQELAELKQKMDAEEAEMIRRHEEVTYENVQRLPGRKGARLVLLQ